MRWQRQAAVGWPYVENSHSRQWLARTHSSERGVRLVLRTTPYEETLEVQTYGDERIGEEASFDGFNIERGKTNLHFRFAGL